MKARYIRVSTAHQNLERQTVKAHPDEKIYLDVISGAKPFKERPQGAELLRDVEAGQVTSLTVSSIDRLGRNLYDILSTIEVLNHYQINLRVENLGLDSFVNGRSNSAFKLIISVMANIAEMERETLLERQKEGIAEAKKRGVYKGREKGSVESDQQFLSKYKEVIKSLKKGNSLRDTAKICNVSLGTVQKVRKMLAKKSILE